MCLCCDGVIESERCERLQTDESVRAGKHANFCDAPLAVVRADVGDVMAALWRAVEVVEHGEQLVQALHGVDW